MNIKFNSFLKLLLPFLFITIVVSLFLLTRKLKIESGKIKVEKNEILGELPQGTVYFREGGGGDIIGTVYKFDRRKKTITISSGEKLINFDGNKIENVFLLGECDDLMYLCYSKGKLSSVPVDYFFNNVIKKDKQIRLFIKDMGLSNDLSSGLVVSQVILKENE